MVPLATAKALAAAALAKAGEIGKPVTVCIVDVRGLIVYMERQDGAPAFTSTTAEGKAAGSAFTGRASSALATIAQNNVTGTLAISARLGGRYTPAQGGLPLVHGEEVVGAIAVAGATAEEDELCARTAMEQVPL
jgi:glc operon protein GlcG